MTAAVSHRIVLASRPQGEASGCINDRETIARDLAVAPEAFLGLLKGGNFGKQRVRLA